MDPRTESAVKELGGILDEIAHKTDPDFRGLGELPMAVAAQFSTRLHSAIARHAPSHTPHQGNAQSTVDQHKGAMHDVGLLSDLIGIAASLKAEFEAGHIKPDEPGVGAVG